MCRKTNSESTCVCLLVGVCVCVCSLKGKNCFDTEIKLCIVTRHCLTGMRDGGDCREPGRITDRGMNGRKKGMHRGHEMRERDILSLVVTWG